MERDHWLGSLLGVSFRALTLLAEWQDGHPDHKKPVPLINNGSLPEQVEEETEVQLESGR